MQGDPKPDTGEALDWQPQQYIEAEPHPQDLGGAAQIKKYLEEVDRELTIEIF